MKWALHWLDRALLVCFKGPIFSPFVISPYSQIYCNRITRPDLQSWWWSQSVAPLHVIKLFIDCRWMSDTRSHKIWPPPPPLKSPWEREPLLSVARHCSQVVGRTESLTLNKRKYLVIFFHHLLKTNHCSPTDREKKKKMFCDMGLTKFKFETWYRS